MRWIAGALALNLCFAAAAAERPLKKRFGEDFNPYGVTPDFIEACRIAVAMDEEKLSDDQAAVGLICLGMVAGVAGVFDGSPRFTLDDGDSTIAICPQGKATYREIVTRALELAESGEVDPKTVTPAHLALAAVMRFQQCAQS